MDDSKKVAAGYIIFRDLGDNVAPDCEPNCEWQVEYHEGGRGFPSGVAWVLVPPPSEEGSPLLKFVFVVDGSRHQGIATRLLEACERRWPGLELTGPISEAGAALIHKLRPEMMNPEPEQVFTKEHIERCLQAGVTREELKAAATRIPLFEIFKQVEP